MRKYRLISKTVATVNELIKNKLHREESYFYIKKLLYLHIYIHKIHCAL